MSYKNTKLKEKGSMVALADSPSGPAFINPF
jgi:hypothetical protein